MSVTPQVPNAGTNGPTERKTKLASLATFAVSFVGLSLLSGLSTDLVESLPDWLETSVYSAIVAGTTFLTGFYTKHKPAALSQSALDAARRHLNGLGDRG